MSSARSALRPARRRLRAAVVALAVAATTLLVPVPASAAGVAEIEPNATTAQAQALPLGSTLSGSFRTSGDCDNNFYDCDVYRISAPAAGQLTLDLRFASTLGTDATFDLVVMNASGTTTYSTAVSASDYSGATLRGLAMFVDAGTSYVRLKARVSGFGSGYVWKGQPYTLKASVAPGLSESEPNGTTATADLLEAGRTIAGSTFRADCGSYDCDYFRVPLTTAARVAVDFRFPCNLGTGQLYTVSTYDNAGQRLSSTRLTGSDCTGAALRKAPVSAPKGNLYVLVESRTGGVTSGKRYTLNAGRIITPGKPTVTGQTKVGATLLASPGTWSPSSVTLSYQWLRDGKVVTGATRSTYKLTVADAGHVVSVKVIGSRTGYTNVSATSPSKAVTLLSIGAKTPKISGTPRVGTRITAVPGAWTPSTVTLRYQWLRDGKAIAGATASTYKVVTADVGRAVSVKVTGVKTGYQTVSRTSTAVRGAR